MFIAAIRALLTRWSVPLLFASLVYFLGIALSQWLFQEGPWPSAIPLDLGLHLMLALLLWHAFRSRLAFGVLLILFTALLHLGHAAKTAILGRPISPDDLYALQAFLSIAEPWQRVLVLGGAGLAGLALVLGLDWRRWQGRLAMMTLVGLGGAVALTPAPLVAWMDRQFGYVDWNPAGDYHYRGPTIHSLQEVARSLADQRPLPTAQEVAAALPTPPPGQVLPATLASPGRSRNLHVIVLESFWDAGRLGALLDQDPLPADFRALWTQAGHSQILSPVFGGYTANAEFEALCGFPVTEPAVRFERQVTRQVPCLPAVLGANGYVNLASHPNTPGFWNRHNVYPRIGFDVYWAGADFVYDDMNDEFLGDRSLYRQVLGKIDPLLNTGQPIFNYILTFFGHLPYPLSADRPPLFTSHSRFPEVAAYASTLYYKAREFMDFLKELRARDPDALIVAFGDHLPVLGEKFGAYVEAGLLTPDRESFTPEMYLNYLGTPLLILDGRNGPLPVGQVPLYRLPALLLALLGNPNPGILAYAAPPDNVRLRPLEGLQIALGTAPTICREPGDAPDCGLAASWLGQVQRLAADLFIGHQYALPATPGAPAPKPAHVRPPFAGQTSEGRERAGGAVNPPAASPAS